MNNIQKDIIRDIKLELDDEFDQNFDRQSFFGDPWVARNPDIKKGKSLLIDSGALRRSIRSEIRGDSLVYSSDLAYASIHNEGGEITVTAKMKGYFWARYIRANGGVNKKKNGDLRKGKANEHLSGEAEFYKAMALKKVGSKIKIPQRQFIGEHPRINQSIEEITDIHVQRYADDLLTQIKNKL